MITFDSIIWPISEGLQWNVNEVITRNSNIVTRGNRSRPRRFVSLTTGLHSAGLERFLEANRTGELLDVVFPIDTCKVVQASGLNVTLEDNDLSAMFYAGSSIPQNSNVAVKENGEWSKNGKLTLITGNTLSLNSAPSSGISHIAPWFLCKISDFSWNRVSPTLFLAEITFEQLQYPVMEFTSNMFRAITLNNRYCTRTEQQSDILEVERIDFEGTFKEFPRYCENSISYQTKFKNKAESSYFRRSLSSLVGRLATVEASTYRQASCEAMGVTGAVLELNWNGSPTRWEDNQDLLLKVYGESTVKVYSFNSLEASSGDSEEVNVTEVASYATEGQLQNACFWVAVSRLGANSVVINHATSSISSCNFTFESIRDASD